MKQAYTVTIESEHRIGKAVIVQPALVASRSKGFRTIAGNNTAVSKGLEAFGVPWVALQKLEGFTSQAENQPFGQAKRAETSKSAKSQTPLTRAVGLGTL